jgi:DNA-binding winged helix-turn-helix (wHTH) protein/TolB-like protein/Tfp pilus assembly protein PilF
MTNGLQSPIYVFGEFRVDTAKRLLLGDAEEIIPLTPKVFDTLLYLVENCGKVIEKDELMREIWTDTIVEENNLNKNISVLRRVLGEKPGEHRFIVTVPGHGYKFVAEVRTISDLGFGIADLTSEETVPANESASAEIQIANNEKSVNDKSPNDKSSIPNSTFRIRNPESETQNPRRFAAALAVLGVLAVGAVVLWFYAAGGTEKNAADAPIKSIAVLPFKSLGAENRNAALEMGMADTLISKLGGGEIIVRPLGSVSRYADLKEDSLVAGRELGVETVLDGTIQTADSRIRISVRLFRTVDGRQLWSGRFDEKFTDIFAVQDSISERVAAALKITLGNEEKKHPTENVEAYQLYMKGRFYLLKSIKSETGTSISYFQQAIGLDPNYALAYTGLSDAYRGQTVGGEMSAGEIMPKARAAALRAIELDDGLAEAHANLGHIMFWYDWDWNGAEKEFQRALQLDPNSPDTLQFYAHLLSASGRHAEALANMKRARELDPLNLRVNAIEGMLLIYAGKIDEAIARLQKTLELDPNYRLALMMAARAFIEKGMFAEALAATSRAREVSPVSSDPVAYGTYALAKSGRRAEAQTALGEFLNSANERYVPPYNIALIYNALGESGKALDYLEKGFAEKDVRMVFLKVEPKWNNLRAEPRFAALLKKMNFE